MWYILLICYIYVAEVYYRAGISPKQYQVELERQLRKTTLGISVGLLKSFAPDTNSMFDPYGHFGQTFQQIGDDDNNINHYKICEVKPPSIEKVSFDYYIFIFLYKNIMILNNFC